LKSKKFWDKFANSYDAGVRKYTEAYKRTIEISRKYLKQDDMILDYGCGTGLTTFQMAADVKQIEAIDISTNMIKVAREKQQKLSIENINFSSKDLFDSSFQPASFDVVCAFNILYFIHDSQEVFEHIYKLLKPEGIFISVTDCLAEKKNLQSKLKLFLSRIGLLPYMKMYTIKSLKAEITASRFKILESTNLYPDPPNYFIAAQKKV